MLDNPSIFKAPSIDNVHAFLVISSVFFIQSSMGMEDNMIPVNVESGKAGI